MWMNANTKKNKTLDKRNEDTEVVVRGKSESNGENIKRAKLRSG